MKRRHLLLAAAGAIAFGQSGSPEVYAIQNATIHTAAGPVITNGTIVVRNGLIDAIGAGAPVPAGAWTIDGKGLHVYPGLIDALSRWGLPAAPEAAPAARPAAAAAPGGRRGAGDEPPANVQFQDDGGPEERPSNTSWIKAADLIQPGDANLAAARMRELRNSLVPTRDYYAFDRQAIRLSPIVMGPPVRPDCSQLRGGERRDCERQR